VAESLPPDTPGKFAYDGLDRVLHEKARLGILTALVSRPDGLPFTELLQLCALTDGNLNRHLGVLAEAGFVEISKTISERRPRTICRLTPLGRQRFREYLTQLEQVLRDAALAERRTAGPETGTELAPT
jgi:DNA-binding MarR family transcriptional regulator